MRRVSVEKVGWSVAEVVMPSSIHELRAVAAIMPTAIQRREIYLLRFVIANNRLLEGDP
jgi:hypothetical protein